jgi:GTP-binding protein
MNKSIVALVGRPNVGKSTLFNRLVGDPIAVVEDLPGTTRDRNYGDLEWAGRVCTLVDTGGIEESPATPLGALIRDQAKRAIAEADQVVLCLDAREGLTTDDYAAARILRESGKPTVIAATKSDTPARRLNANEFHALGFGDVIPVSALHGLGTGDLLDWIVSQSPPEGDASELDEPRFAIAGRPNVGKSSLLNAIVGDQRAIVSSEPGTTRDAIDSTIQHEGRTITLVDTAGMRRRGKVSVGVEKYSVMRTLRAINRADVVLLIIDASEGVTAQDAHLAGYVRQSGRGCVLVVNKWDLLPKGDRRGTTFDAQLRHVFNFMPWAEVVHVSAVTRSRIRRPLDLALASWAERRRRIPTAELNRTVRDALERHPPPSHKGQTARIYYVTQAEVAPPTFVFFVNDPERIHLTYERYLENQIREAFGFRGTPIRLRFRGRDTQTEDDEKKD